MTSYPAGDDQEPRWQQPAFQPGEAAEPAATSPGGRVMPPFGAHLPVPYAPPSMLETVVGSLAGLVWPVAILLVIVTRIGFWPILITALVVGSVLSAVKRNLKQRRRALPPPPTPGGPADLR